jgi:hypothetical protein
MACPCPPRVCANQYALTFRIEGLPILEIVLFGRYGQGQAMPLLFCSMPYFLLQDFSETARALEI